MKESIRIIFEISKTEDGYNPNKFIDLLSRKHGGLTLSQLKNIDYFYYVYLKQSCKEFFNDYPYIPEEKITTTYLFVWSEGKILSDIPHKKFGF